MTKILVYGTLRSGFGAHRKLTGAEYQGDARVPGYDMINLGGFPGIIPNPDNKDGIVGEVYDGVGPEMLTELDYYEGYREDKQDTSFYLRKEIDVGGDKVLIYELNPKQVHREWYEPIPSGDWRNR